MGLKKFLVIDIPLPPLLSLSLSLPQPFPHHQFTSEEMTQSLLSLGLCPSASLVVPRQTSQSSSVASPTGSQTGQTGSSSAQSSGSQTGQTGLPSLQSRSIATGKTGSDTGGAGVGKGNDEMEISGEVVNERPADVDMEDESHSHSDGEDMELESDGDDDDIPQLPPVPHPLRPIFAPPRFGLRPPAPRQRPPRIPPMQFPGFPPLGGGEVFGGEGQRLGGKEAAVIGDSQLIRQEAGR